MASTNCCVTYCMVTLGAAVIDGTKLANPQCCQLLEHCRACTNIAVMLTGSQHCSDGICFSSNHKSVPCICQGFVVYNQSVDQSVNQLVTQSIRQSISQTISQSISQSINQSINTIHSAEQRDLQFCRPARRSTDTGSSPGRGLCRSGPIKPSQNRQPLLGYWLAARRIS